MLVSPLLLRSCRTSCARTLAACASGVGGAVAAAPRRRLSLCRSHAARRHTRRPAPAAACASSNQTGVQSVFLPCPVVRQHCRSSTRQDDANLDRRPDPDCLHAGQRQGLRPQGGPLPKLRQPAKDAGNDNHEHTIAKSLQATARQRTRLVTGKVRETLTSLSAPRENIYNLPNFLTVTRLFAAPATAYLLLHDHHAWALALFAYAGITDLVDGWLARRWKLQTVAGSVIDPMADKSLMIILTITLAAKGAIPLYLAALILGRDASLAVAAIYYRYASLPTPKTFMRYWDFTLPSAEVHPTTVSKYNTFLQLILIGSALGLPVVTNSSSTLSLLDGMGLGPDRLHHAMTYLQWVVAATTTWSGLSYAYLKNAVTILGNDEHIKAKQGSRGRAIIGFTFGGVIVYAAWAGLTAGGSPNTSGEGASDEVQ